MSHESQIAALDIIEKILKRVDYKIMVDDITKKAELFSLYYILDKIHEPFLELACIEYDEDTDFDNFTVHEDESYHREYLFLKVSLNTLFQYSIVT